MYNLNLHIKIKINITSNLHVNVKSKTNLKSEFFLEVFGNQLFANFCTRSHKKYLFAYNEVDGNKCFYFYSSDTKIAVKPKILYRMLKTVI